jgi:ectoine hydroxylase-related dioxygenase (phytanoyl-CoA dioxygenase family)
MLDLSVIRDPVACPLPPGGITIHRNRTAHYAGPNTSDVPRRALILGSSLPAQPYPGTRRFPWNEIKVAPRQARAAAAQAKS